jgi:hypothetical protein
MLPELHKDVMGNPLREQCLVEFFAPLEIVLVMVASSSFLCFPARPF